MTKLNNKDAVTQIEHGLELIDEALAALFATIPSNKDEKKNQRKKTLALTRPLEVHAATAATLASDINTIYHRACKHAGIQPYGGQ